MNKQQYLTARASWKAKYAQLTLDIRAAKVDRTETARALAKHGSHKSGPENVAHNKRWVELANAHIAAYSRCKVLRDRAADSLEELKALKADAQASYLAEREAMTA